MSALGPKQRFAAHLEAITAQLGPTATPGRLSLARRIAGLMLVCENHERELTETGKTDAREYRDNAKLLQSLSVACGLCLNPRTARPGEAGSADSHAAALMDD